MSISVIQIAKENGRKRTMKEIMKIQENVEVIKEMKLENICDTKTMIEKIEIKVKRQQQKRNKELRRMIRVIMTIHNKKVQQKYIEKWRKRMVDGNRKGHSYQIEKVLQEIAEKTGIKS